MGVDTGAIESFLDSMGYSHKYMVESFVPPLVYHYTNLEALKGIVGDHDLWLTNSLYSNDADESSHGFEIAREVIETYLKEAKDKRTQEEVNYVEKLFELMKTPEWFYICCFCEEGASGAAMVRTAPGSASPSIRWSLSTSRGRTCRSAWA